MLKKIYMELVAIRKELKAIRSSMEPQNIWSSIEPRTVSAEDSIRQRREALKELISKPGY